MRWRARVSYRGATPQELRRLLEGYNTGTRRDPETAETTAVDRRSGGGVRGSWI